MLSFASSSARSFPLAGTGQGALRRHSQGRFSCKNNPVANTRWCPTALLLGNSHGILLSPGGAASPALHWGLLLGPGVSGVPVVLGLCGPARASPPQLVLLEQHLHQGPRVGHVGGLGGLPGDQGAGQPHVGRGQHIPWNPKTERESTARRSRQLPSLGRGTKDPLVAPGMLFGAKDHSGISDGFAVAVGARQHQGTAVPVATLHPESNNPWKKLVISIISTFVPLFLCLSTGGDSLPEEELHKVRVCSPGNCSHCIPGTGACSPPPCSLQTVIHPPCRDTPGSTTRQPGVFLEL